jgi:5-methylthioadenosine/S-adenosylhomocysteine deaminase
MSFLITGATLLTNDSACEVSRDDLRVENGRITAIAKNLAPNPNETVVNLSGLTLIPGFVQTHVHLCQTLFRNLADDLALLDWLSQRIWPMEGAHTPNSLRASAELGILELLAGGTTTILDMGTVRHTEQIFMAAEELGIRAFIGKCLMDRDDNPASLRESTAQALKETEALFKQWHGRANDRLRYAPAPRFVLSCTEALLRQTQELCTQHNLTLHTHASENRDEVARVLAMTGQENIAYLHSLGLTGPKLVLAHCIWLSENEIKILQTTQTKVSHCPSSNLKLASGIAKVPQLRQAGVSVSLGADGAPCNNRLDMFQEMRLASLIQKPLHGPTAMPAKEVFQMATIDGARALGLGDELGSLSVGKKADFVALDLNRIENMVDCASAGAQDLYSAIVYSASPANVAKTWVDGRLVYDRGEYPGFDAANLKQRALRERRLLLDTLRQDR